MTSTLLLRGLAWVLFAGLVVVTLGPIGWRPVTLLPVQIERATGLAIVGLAFALAYPRHIWLVAMIVVGGAALLEFGQTFEPGRHGRLADFLAKAIGGGCGLFIGWIISRRSRRETR